jgi:hypothetical protein
MCPHPYVVGLDLYLSKYLNQYDFRETFDALSRFA